MEAEAAGAAEGVGGVPVTIAVDQGPGQVYERALDLPPGARLGDALAALGFPPDTDAGVWGRACPADTLLQPGARVEIYRALRVDPKTARRERFREQGARGTGLFARK